MKTKLFFSFFVLFLSFGFGQTQQLLAELQKKYNNSLPYKMNFVYTLKDPEGKSLYSNQKGILHGEKQKFFLKMVGQDFLSDGSKIYNINHEDREVVIENFSAETTNFISPLEILKKNNTKYNYKWVSAKNVLLVTPKNNNDVVSISIFLDKKKNITSFVQKNSDNSSITVKIVTFERSKSFPVNYFRFNKQKFSAYYITSLD